jgi:8-oxo-dGTP diphosphatase
MNSVPTVGIVVIQGNKVLLVREGEKSAHLTGFYNTPAGRIEEGEMPAAAAVRELKEETGLETSEENLIELSKKYIADIKRKSGETVSFYHTVFVCTKFAGELKSSDDVEPMWIEIEKVHSLKLLPNIVDMISEAKTTSDFM